MIDSVPVSMLRLGLRFDEYEKVAKNITRITSIPRSVRQEILRRANRELPSKTINNANMLVFDMADDRVVYRIARLRYWIGPPRGENLFSTAVFDYLLSSRYFQ